MSESGAVSGPGSRRPAALGRVGVEGTAFWMAVNRARESGRSDRLFHDPFAAELVESRVDDVARLVESQARSAWAYVVRTVLFDRLIERAVAGGVELVLDLGAGLGTRPYRLPLPDTLRWVEVDHGGVLEHKDRVLAPHRPRCELERVSLDLARVSERRALFRRLTEDVGRALVVSEGLLVYLEPSAVEALARDLGESEAYVGWITDMVSPGLLRLLRKRVAAALESEAAPLRFAPDDGVAFFEELGWTVPEMHSVFVAAAEVGRLPPWMRFFVWLNRLRRRPRPPPYGVWSLQRRGAGPEG